LGGARRELHCITLFPRSFGDGCHSITSRGPTATAYNFQASFMPDLSQFYQPSAFSVCSSGASASPQTRMLMGVTNQPSSSGTSPHPTRIPVLPGHQPKMPPCLQVVYVQWVYGALPHPSLSRRAPSVGLRTWPKRVSCSSKSFSAEVRISNAC
jgi:hypothetical protein